MKNRAFFFMFSLLFLNNLVTNFTFFIVNLFYVFVHVAEVCEHGVTKLTLVRLLLGMSSQMVIQLEYISKVMLAVTMFTKVHFFLFLSCICYELSDFKLSARWNESVVVDTLRVEVLAINNFHRRFWTYFESFTQIVEQILVQQVDRRYKSVWTFVIWSAVFLYNFSFRFCVVICLDGHAFLMLSFHLHLESLLSLSLVVPMWPSKQNHFVNFVFLFVIFSFFSYKRRIKWTKI